MYYNAGALPEDVDATLEFTSRFRPSMATTWSNATHLCVVEIDPARTCPGSCATS